MKLAALSAVAHDSCERGRRPPTYNEGVLTETILYVWPPHGWEHGLVDNDSARVGEAPFMGAVVAGEGAVGSER